VEVPSTSEESPKAPIAKEDDSDEVPVEDGATAPISEAAQEASEAKAFEAKHITVAASLEEKVKVSIRHS
jgi:hypothetical protein